MALAGVGARQISGGETVVDMLPVVGAGLGRIDADLFDGVDRLQHALDFRPAGNAQQDLAAGAHVRNSRIGFAACDGAQNVDARDDGAEIVRGPADIGEEAVRREAQDAPAAVEDLLGDLMTEADPVLDLLLDQISSTCVRLSDGCSVIDGFLRPPDSLRPRRARAGSAEAAILMRFSSAGTAPTRTRAAPQVSEEPREGLKGGVVFWRTAAALLRVPGHRSTPLAFLPGRIWRRSAAGAP